jgi:hypothetical protein
MRKALVSVLVAAFGVLSFAGAGTASADTPIPMFWTIAGDNFGTFGDHAYCRGALHVSFSAPAGKPGHVRTTVTSHGFTGDGPGWARNPHCRVTLVMTEISPKHFYKTTRIPMSFGRKPGQRVSRILEPGSGPAIIGVGTYGVGRQSGQVQSYGSEARMWVP